MQSLCASCGLYGRNEITEPSKTLNDPCRYEADFFIYSVWLDGYLKWPLFLNFAGFLYFYLILDALGGYSSYFKSVNFIYKKLKKLKRLKNKNKKHMFPFCSRSGIGFSKLSLSVLYWQMAFSNWNNKIGLVNRCP